MAKYASGDDRILAIDCPALFSSCRAVLPDRSRIGQPAEIDDLPPHIQVMQINSQLRHLRYRDAPISGGSSRGDRGDRVLRRPGRGGAPAIGACRPTRSSTASSSSPPKTAAPTPRSSPSTATALTCCAATAGSRTRGCSVPGNPFVSWPGRRREKHGIGGYQGETVQDSCLTTRISCRFGYAVLDAPQLRPRVWSAGLAAGAHARLPLWQTAEPPHSRSTRHRSE